MTEQPTQTDQQQHYWSQSASAARWREQDATPLRRFLGGPPLGVLIRLVVISFLVGALLVWLRITPADVFEQLLDLLNRLGLTSLRSLRDVGDYLVAGAAIVVPVWLVIRLFSFRVR